MPSVPPGIHFFSLQPMKTSFFCRCKLLHVVDRIHDKLPRCLCLVNTESNRGTYWPWPCLKVSEGCHGSSSPWILLPPGGYRGQSQMCVCVFSGFFYCPSSLVIHKLTGWYFPPITLCAYCSWALGMQVIGRPWHNNLIVWYCQQLFVCGTLRYERQKGP